MEEHVSSQCYVYEKTFPDQTVEYETNTEKHILILKSPFSFAAFEPSRSSQIKYFQVNSADRGIQKGPNLFDRIAQSIQRAASS